MLMSLYLLDVFGHVRGGWGKGKRGWGNFVVVQQFGTQNHHWNKTVESRAVLEQDSRK